MPRWWEKRFIGPMYGLEPLDHKTSVSSTDLEVHHTVNVW